MWMCDLLLANSFKPSQESALEDYIEASVIGYSITVTDIHFMCTKFNDYNIDCMKFEEQEMRIICTF